MKLWPFGKKAAPVHSGGGAPIYFLTNLGLDTGPGYDYAKRVGTGMDASVVMAPVQWMQRAMMEAPLVVQRRDVDGEWEEEGDHPLSVLLHTPNEFYAGSHLWAGTILSYLTDGNAYWIVVRNGTGLPMELWYVPHWMMRPVGSKDGVEFITHYEYSVAGKRIRIEREDVVHFRHGVDPRNPRLGLSPLASAVREIWTDIEASEFIASVLRNNGIPGIMVTPDSDAIQPGPGDADIIKAYVKEHTTGRKRGEPMVLSGKTKVERLSWNPQEMNLTPASDRSEERVCALLGIPAAVVGFSAGLQSTKVGATMTEMRKLAWWNGVIPVQRGFGDTVERTLLSQFGDTVQLRSRFDNTEVAALQEDETAIFERADKGVRGGWLTVATAKRMVGVEPEEADDVYLRGLATSEVPLGVVAALPAPGTEKGFKQAIDADTLFEQRVARDGTFVEATAAQNAYMDVQERMAPALEAKLHTTLEKFFTGILGAAAEAAAVQHLTSFEKQALLDDAVVAERIITAMAMAEITPIWKQVLEAHFLVVSEEATSAAMGTMGLVVGVPDEAARAIVATGGTRAGLIDLTKQSKTALFTALEQARAEGLGVDAAARKVRGLIEAGPWRTVETRARIIARTETKYAQRVSTLHMSSAQGITQFRVYDARIGLTDAECTSLDGILVDARTADELAASEHPNGTRDFVPHIS